MIRKFRRNKIREAHLFVEPDEIFLDSKNLAKFDTQQFEGRIEKTISKNAILFLGLFFGVFVLVFFVRLGILQIKKGQAYFERSENNTLQEIILFADRGIIYDRNGIELAWNKKGGTFKQVPEEGLVEKVQVEPGKSSLDEEKDTGVDEFGVRAYNSPGFSHILGYVKSPTKDSSGNYWQTDFVGMDGLEKVYDEKIRGKNGSKLIEVDAKGKIHSENTVNAPVRGEALYTTLDAKVNKKLYNVIKKTATDSNYAGGAGIIMDVTTGEIIAATSYPEYSSEILSYGKDSKTIESYLTDKRKVFLDKTISGLYTPGSIVKPFFALGALNENLITPEKQIYSAGSISIPNPFDKKKESVFKDWRAHGWTDMAEAIAVSSDVYFYSIGGGFKDQRGLGIARLEEYARLFGIGEKTGVDLPDETDGTIPSPAWKATTFKGDPWRIGDTYNTSIGQYGFQVTPLEMTRAVSAIANFGTLLTPHFILGDTEKENQTRKIDLPKEYFSVVQKGMREAVTYGTALPLNVDFVDIAAKTGTAQVGAKKNKVNSWVIGFFPYENPKYAFTIMMEAAPSSSYISAASVMRNLVDYMYWETPEYFGIERKVKPEEAPDEETDELIDTQTPQNLEQNQEIPEVSEGN